MDLSESTTEKNFAFSVTLEAVVFPRDEYLLARWLYSPHVTKWWGDPVRRMNQLRNTLKNKHAVIYVDRTPVGYVRWQEVIRQDLDDVGLTNIPDGAIDIDIFIGDSAWLGRGVGPRALRMLVNQLRETTQAPLAGLCTSVQNLAAIRAFERAGFHKRCQFHDPRFGRC